MGRKLLGSSLSNSSDEITFGSKVDLKKVWKQAQKEGLTYDVTQSGVLSFNDRCGDIRLQREDVEPLAGVISFEGREGDIKLRNSDVENLTNLVGTLNKNTGNFELTEEDCVITLNGRSGNVELIHDDIKALIPSGNGVESFNGRLGDIVLTQEDVFKTLMADGLPNGVGVFSDKAAKLNLGGGEQKLSLRASDKATVVEFNSPKDVAPFHIKDGKTNSKYLTIYHGLELDDVKRIKWKGLEETSFTETVDTVYQHKIGLADENCSVKAEISAQDLETFEVSFKTDLFTANKDGFNSELAYKIGRDLFTTYLEVINGELNLCVVCSQTAKVTAKVQKFSF